MPQPSVSASVRTAVPPLVCQEDDRGLVTEALCHEIIAAAAGQRTERGPAATSVWSVHFNRSQLPLRKALIAGDAEGLGDLLRRLHRTSITHGFDQHAEITAKLDNEERFRTGHARRIYWQLQRTAAGLGFSRLYNPEQDENFPDLTENCVDRLLPAVLRALRQPAALPMGFGGQYGIDSVAGILSQRQALALGYAREVQDWCGEAGTDYSALVEIGGGLGRCACLLARSASVPVALIDLPSVNVVQYAFLRANGVPARLWPESYDCGFPGVQLFSAFAHAPLEELQGALFVNFDSFVEMDRGAQDGYFRLIAETGSDLLSVNHEAAREILGGRASQQWDIARIAGLGLRPHGRRLFWEREGYVVQGFTRA